MKDVALNIMKEAADEVRINANCTEGEVVDAGISNDGTWQKRGFSLLNGVVASLSIDTGKVLDIEVMSRYCNVCVNTKIVILNNTNSSQNLTNQSGVCLIIEALHQRWEWRALLPFTTVAFRKMVRDT